MKEEMTGDVNAHCPSAALSSWSNSLNLNMNTPDAVWAQEDFPDSRTAYRTRHSASCDAWDQGGRK